MTTAHNVNYSKLNNVKYIQLAEDFCAIKQAVNDLESAAIK